MTTAAKRCRRSGRGAILLISGLLLGSAAIRAAAGAGQVLTADSVQTAAAGASDASATSQSEITSGTSAESLSAMLKAFRVREARIVEREQQIDMRLKALSVADEQIERRLATLQDAETKLRETLSLASTAAESDLARLTSVYENMKPKDAAALFEAMEPTFAAGFLGRMRANAAAGVMAGLSPEAAYSISVILAGRNANAPKG